MRRYGVLLLRHVGAPAAGADPISHSDEHADRHSHTDFYTFHHLDANRHWHDHGHADYDQYPHRLTGGGDEQLDTNRDGCHHDSGERRFLAGNERHDSSQHADDARR